MSGAKHKSKTVSKEPDRNDDPSGIDSRAVRTRAQINHAFVDLLHRRSYDTLRVSDITRKAGVGRATFYAHFNSKDDLLRSQLQRVVLPMLQIQSDEPFLIDCRRFFAHISSAPQIYRTLMGGRERAGARVIRETLEQHFESALGARAAGEDDIPTSLVTRFVVSVLLGVTAHALSAEGTVAPEQMQRYFQQLVGSGLTHAGEPRENIVFIR